MNLFRFRPTGIVAEKNQSSSSRFQLTTGAAVLSLAIAASTGQLAHAAETISLEYGPIQRSLPVKDLKDFAATKKPSGLLADLITFARQEPETVHSLLTSTVPMKVTTMDRMVNSYIGSIILGQIGRVILPLSRAGDPIGPLKAGLVGSIKNDEFSILSFIENYPVDMKINGEQFFAIRKQLEDDGKYLPEILTGLQGVMSKVVPGFSFNNKTEPTPRPAPSPTPTPTASPMPAPTPAPIVTPSPVPTSTPQPGTTETPGFVTPRTHRLQF